MKIEYPKLKLLATTFINAIKKALACVSLTVLLNALASHAQSAYSNAVINLNPVAYWPMHEVEPPAPGPVETNYGTLGSIANGYVGTWETNNPRGGITNQIPGALSNDPDTAMAFSSAHPWDCLLVPMTSPQVPLTPPFTIECWASHYGTSTSGEIVGARGTKLNGGGGASGYNGVGLNWGGTSATEGFQIIVANNGDSGTAVTLAGGGPVANNTWYYVVATCDANTNWTIYTNGVVTALNGQYQAFTGCNWLPLTIGGGFWEGNLGCFRPFEGGVDEVALYTNVLSLNRIQAHYDAGLNPATYGAYETNVLADSPLLYYHMDAPTYTPPSPSSLPVLNNYGSSAINGIYTPGAMPGAVTGPFSATGVPFGGLTASNALPGNGVSSFADAGYSPMYSIPPGMPFAVTAMFKGNPTDPRTNSIVSNGSNSWQVVLNASGHIECHSGNGAIAATPAANDLTSLGVYNDGNWHQLVYTYNGTNTQSLYMDGVLDTNRTTTAFTNGVGSTLDLFIGADPSWTNSPGGFGRQFAGNVCEVALFTNAFTATQVQTLYNAAGVAPSITITGQPATGRNQNGGAGSYIYFGVDATGSSLSYQWYFNTSSNYSGAIQLANNTDFLNATTDELTVTNLTANDSGYYFVVITNNYGSVTSILTSLTVNLAPTIINQLPVTYSNILNTNFMTLFAGANPAFSVSVVGTTPYYYQWFTNGVADGNAATNASFTLTNIQASFINYCIVTNISGAATSTVWSVSVVADPTNSNGGLSPYPQTVLADGPMGYWRLNEGNDNGNGDDGYIAYDYAGGNDGIYTNVSLGNTGYNPIEDPSDTSAEFGEFAYGPLPIVNEYAGQIQGIDFAAPSGSSADFTVEAWVNGYSGANQQVTDGAVATKGFYGVNDEFYLGIDLATTHYRFYVRGANGTEYDLGSGTMPAIDGNWHHLVGVCNETNGLLSLYFDGQVVNTEAIPTNAGVYEADDPMTIGASTANGTNYAGQFNGFINDVAVYNYAMSASQVAAQYVSTGVPPILTQPPPAAVITNGGSPLVVPVAAIGTGPLNYVWSDVSGGTNIVTGSTNGNILNATLTVASLPAGWNNDLLELSVTGVDGTTNVSVALTLATNAPEITQNLPAQVNLVSGKSYTYSIEDIGMSPMSYQWFNGATSVEGQTSASYTVVAGSPGSTTYYVVITNVNGSVTSTVSMFTSIAQLSNTYATNILGLNPVGYWPLQETNPPAAATMETNYGTLGAAGNAYYAATNAADVLFGQAGPLAGSGNYSVDFNGDPDSWAFIPRTAPAIALKPPLTLEAWVNAANTQVNKAVATQDILGQGDAANGVRMAWIVSGTGGIAAIFRNGGPYVQFNYPAPGNQWDHCVLTFDGTNVNFYLNGIALEVTNVNYNGTTEYSTNSTTTMSSSPYAPLTIGNGLWDDDSPIRPFNGSEAEVAVYTNVLTAQQVANHYEAATSGNYFQTVLNDGPLLYYLMDCSGYTNVSPVLCPVAVNYGSAMPNGAYLSGLVPGGVAGPAMANSSNLVAAPVNGEISCVDAGYDPTFNPSGSQPFTAMTWFRGYPTDERTNTLMGHGAQNWSLNLNTSGNLVWNLYNAGSVTSTKVVNDGNWHQAVGVYNGADLYLYVDGQLNSSAAATGGLTGETTADLYLGGNADFAQVPYAQQFFAGALAQAALFTNALTAVQIQAVYVSSQPVTVSTNPTNIVFSITGTNQLTLSWPANHMGWTLQAQTNSVSVGLSTNWANVAGSSTNNQVIVPINLTNGSVFYRLIYTP